MHARTYRRALALLVPALGMVAGATVAAAPAQAAPLCSVSYTGYDWDATGSFPPGFQGEFLVTNNSATKTKGWRIEVHFRTGIEVLQYWNSARLLNVPPVYVFGNVSYNGELPKGASTSFGVIGRKSANNIPHAPADAVCAPIY